METFNNNTDKLISKLFNWHVGYEIPFGGKPMALDTLKNADQVVRCHPFGEHWRVQLDVTGGVTFEYFVNADSLTDVRYGRVYITENTYRFSHTTYNIPSTLAELTNKWMPFDLDEVLDIINYLENPKGGTSQQRFPYP